LKKRISFLFIQTQYTTTYLHIYTKQVMVFFVVHYFVSFDIAIYYGFSLLHTFSLVPQPWMSAYIRTTDGVFFKLSRASGIFKFFLEEKNIFFVHTNVLSLKTAFNLVKIHLLFRIMILIQWSVNISVFVNYVVIRVSYMGISGMKYLSIYYYVFTYLYKTSHGLFRCTWFCFIWYSYILRI
jgi:hypothetical protein